MPFWSKIKESWCPQWASNRGSPPWQQVDAQRRSPSPAFTSATIISLADTELFQPRDSYVFQRDGHGGSDGSDLNRASGGGVGGIRRATRAVRQVAQQYGNEENIKSVPVIRKYDAKSGNLLFLLPLLVVILVPLTFLVNYVIAGFLGHASWSFPYISDFGNQPPESSVFGLMLSVATLFIAATGYVRYKQILDACSQLRCRRDVRLANQIAAGAGIWFCIGLLTVAHFQIISLRMVHYIGALITFLSASIYAISEAYISHMIYPVVTGSMARILRIFLAFGVTFGFVLMFVFGLLARFNYTGDPESGLWRPKTGGYNWRMFSVVMEYLSAICQLAYIATFVGEFKSIIAAPPSFFVHIDPNKVDQRLSAANDMADQLTSPDDHQDDDSREGGHPPETKAGDLPKELIGYMESQLFDANDTDPLDDSERY